MLLAAADVLVHAGHAFDHGLARAAIDFQYAAADAPIGAGNYFHRISCSNQHRPYTTSLARLTIFINRRSRSSRATAPKIRVPRGLLSLSISTTALLSNRT